MKLSPYQAQLVDPCAAEPFSPYGGESGIVQRFVGDFTAGGATFTAGVFVYYAPLNVYGTISVTASNVAGVLNTAPAVGTNLLGFSARKKRTCAACLELIPASLSYTNITGEIAMGVVDLSTLTGGSSYTPDGVFTLLNERAVLARQDYEVRWYPGDADDQYSLAAAGNTGIFQSYTGSNQNALVIAWRGIPVSTTLNFRATEIAEWTPNPALGLAVTSAPRLPVDFRQQAAALSLAHPSWWTQGWSAISGFGSSVRQASLTDPTIARIYGALQPSNAARFAYNKALTMVAAGM